MPNDLISPGLYSQLPERYRLRSQEIKRRVEEINALMAPCRPEAVKSAVKRMAGQFLPQSDTDAKLIVSEYLAACRDLPEWAVSEAANDFLGGHVESHAGKFMPVCAEFAKRARHILTPFLAEMSSLRVEASKLIERAADDQKRHIIEMERQNPAVRRRVAELTEAFGAGSPQHQTAAHLGLSANRQARIDALKKPRQITSKIGHERKE